MHRASDIASYLNSPIQGSSGLVIHTPSGPADAGPGSALWIKSFSQAALELLTTLDGVLIIHPPSEKPEILKALAEAAESNALLAAENPRLAFARMLDRFFSELQAYVPYGIDQTARIDQSAQIGERVSIGAFCVIGPHVTIGDDTVLHPHVVVYSHSQIGKRCVINSGVRVGARGFGFVKDENGDNIHFPQVGKVIIEDDVEVQANTTIARPGVGVTMIERNAKIDCLCHIGHNSRIGSRAIITACSEIGAGVVVGESAWVGPNSCSLEGVRFGRNSFTGIGSVVLKDVPAGKTHVGSPAVPIDEMKASRAAIQKIMAQQKAKDSK
jgi:UDP-3-O-[3-hydroxymyristoyl] glucosamine N-acyltransferase